MGDQEDPKGKGKQKVPEYQSTPATRAMAMDQVRRYSSGWDSNTSSASAGAPGALRIPGPTPENPEQDAPRAANQPHGLLTGTGQQAGGSSFHQGVDLHDFPLPHLLTISELPPLLCVRCQGPLDACACRNQDAQGVLHGSQQQQFGGNNPPRGFSPKAWDWGGVMARRILRDSPMGQQRPVQNLPPPPPLLPRMPVAALMQAMQQYPNQLGSATIPQAQGPHQLQPPLPQHGAGGVELLQNVEAPAVQLGHPGLQPPPQAHPVLRAGQPGPDPESDLCSACGENPAWVRYQPRRHPCVCPRCRYVRRVVCQVCFYAYADDPVGQHGEAAPPVQLENLGLQAPPQAHPVRPAGQPDPDPESDLCSACGEFPVWMRYQPRRHPCVCPRCRYVRRVVCQVCLNAYADDH